MTGCRIEDCVGELKRVIDAEICTTMTGDHPMESTAVRRTLILQSNTFAAVPASDSLYRDALALLTHMYWPVGQRV